MREETPQGADRFGTLVIIYPTLYEEGELVLRHNNLEWKIDAKSLILSQPSPSLAYLAFRRDVELEVLKVSSGRMVTLTYDLGLVDPASEPGASSAVTPNWKSHSNLQTALEGLLKSPGFLPEGGTIGFGLACLYPITIKTKLQEMASYLKGEDAWVYRACRELGLRPSFRTIYDDDFNDGYGIMLDQMVEDPNYDYLASGDQESLTYETSLLTDYGGVSVNVLEGIQISDSSRVSGGLHEGEHITWVSPLNCRNQLRDINVETRNYKNPVTWIRCNPCIIVRIPAASDRV